MTDEIVITNILCTMFGLDASLFVRFNDDYRYIFKVFQDKGLDINDLKNFLHQFNYNATMRHVTKESLLPKLQLELVGFLSKMNASLETVESVKEVMVTNPGFMENPELYTNSKQDFALVDKEIAALANALRSDLDKSKTM